MKTLTHIIDLTENVEPVQEPWSIEKYNTGLYEAVFNSNKDSARVLCTDKAGRYPIVVCDKNGIITELTDEPTIHLYLIRKQPECIEVVMWQYFRCDGESLGCYHKQTQFPFTPSPTTEVKLIYRLPKNETEKKINRAYPKIIDCLR